MSQSQIQNRLLQKLTPSDLDAVMSCATRVDLAFKQEIMVRGDVISYVYFPEDCVCSLIAQTDHARPIEVGMVGPEGMSDMVSRIGDRTALTSIVQVAGAAWRIRTEDFIRLIHSAPSFDEVTRRFKDALAIQFAYTAFANGNFKVEERLSRWLLMSHDRSRQDTVPMIHQFMAMMLAIRRSGVTTATHILEGAGAIKGLRGAIEIRDRDKLLEIAGESYGTPEAEYERLMVH